MIRYQKRLLCRVSRAVAARFCRAWTRSLVDQSRYLQSIGATHSIHDPNFMNAIGIKSLGPGLLALLQSIAQVCMHLHESDCELLLLWAAEQMLH